VSPTLRRLRWERDVSALVHVVRHTMVGQVHVVVFLRVHSKDEFEVNARLFRSHKRRTSTRAFIYRLDAAGNARTTLEHCKS
jgi:hypothetical protein